MQPQPNSDLLSALPDDVLLRILSSLPAKTAVSTSALSRRWRLLCHSSHRLIFDDAQSPHFPQFLAQTLALHSADLRSLQLFVDDEDPCNLHHINRSLQTAVLAHPRLEQLSVHYYQERRPVALPVSLFNLRFLKEIDLFVANSVCVDLIGSVRLPALERLNLGGFLFDGSVGEDVVSVCFPRLRSWRLSECRGLVFFCVKSPVLEELVVDCCVGIVDVAVRCSGLKRFSFKHCFVPSKFRQCFSVSMPVLEEFTWLDIPPNCFTVKEPMRPKYSSLRVPVAIRYMHCRGALDLLLGLADSKRLDIDSYFFEALFSHLETRLYGGQCMSIFSNIQTLQLSISFGPEQAIKLSAILPSVANIKKLELSFVADTLSQASKDYAKYFADCGNLGKGGYWDSQCLALSNLHQVDISNFRGGVYELDFIEYLLRAIDSLQIIKIREG